ncbi:acyl-CoA synthetase MbcS [Bacillus fonticola]|uniref:acyl-CoA synthetase MbcS n=1 Tax=Bacillus fonticola TaxID=2728853 RepID=UPI00147618CC|nr:acyl--CoA ligase [Bacillus fonticola]
MNREDLLAPETYNIVSEIDKYADDTGKRALIWEDELGREASCTYDELQTRTNQIANAFFSKGLRKGDIVLIMIPRRIEAYEVYVACLRSGLVVLPCSEMLRPKDLQYRIQHSGARAIIAFEPYVEACEEVEETKDLIRFVVGDEQGNWMSLQNSADRSSPYFETIQTNAADLAFLSYTSGTTGNPKGVAHTHGWGYAHLRTAASHWLGIEEGDVVWATAGPGWQKWIWSPFLSVLGMGATGFVYQGPFHAETYLNFLKKHSVQVLCCTPTEYRLMAKVPNLRDWKLPAFRSAVSAGEPLNREVIEVFSDVFGLQVRDGYGQTENTLLVGVTKGMDIRPGSMGKPTPGNSVEIIDEEGNICPIGVVGDIAVHRDTPALFKEYYKDPERTAHQLRGDYYITGDKARMDEDGYFWFEGRGDDMIISSGYTIGPFEVEDALVKHPQVKECAVVASPDPVRGSVVKAYVIPNGVIEDEQSLILRLQEHVKAETAPYKYPREIVFVDELPKTTSGKIRRIELRQAETETKTV